MSHKMTSAERVHAALKGHAVDRVPFCFWHHFQPEGSGERLAELTYDFFISHFHLDIVKIMPDLPYPSPVPAIEHAEQLRFLPPLSLDTPVFQEQLTCIRSLRRRLGHDMPLIFTLFSPLTYTMNFLGKEKALAEARRAPQHFKEGLGTIAANLRKLIEASIEAGASGVFFSCMGATSSEFTDPEYEDFGRPFDLMALHGAEKGWLNIVHIHADPDQGNEHIHFNLFSNYPVQVLSWSDRLTGPNLEEALLLTDHCLMGGLHERGPLIIDDQISLKLEMEDALLQTQSRRLILANGCSLPDDVPDAYLKNARTLLDIL